MSRPDSITLVLIVLGCLAGCPGGKTVPDVTALKAIQGATFILGPNIKQGMIGPDNKPYQNDMGPPSCGLAGTAETLHCDSGDDPGNPLSWLSGLTFVPAATATVTDFQIDESEVTNGQYNYCVELGVCSPPASTDINGTPYFGEADYDNSPVVWVTHQQAMDYCKFVDKRLPNEAEWELAARWPPLLDQNSGQMEPRTFPWGFGTSNCNQGSTFYLLSKGCTQTPLAVDYSNADLNKEDGVRDMGSNVSEWMSDSWDTYAYCDGHVGYDNDCQTKGLNNCQTCINDGDKCAKSCDPAKLVICKAGTYAPASPDGQSWVVRGGSWNHGMCYNRLYVRREESQAKLEIGFRCAR